jgi:3-oxoacyl-[acyl-carrier-protein] synthase II
MSQKRRVVVTGIGAVTPLFSTAEGTWKKLINSESGIGKISLFDTTECPCKIAGEVKYGDGEGLFNPDNHIDQKEQRKMDRFIHFAVGAADQAIADSGWVPSRVNNNPE